MLLMRLLVVRVALVALASTAALTACTDSGSDDAQIAVLEARIAELEQELDEADLVRRAADDLAADVYPNDEPVVTVFIADEIASDASRLGQLMSELTQLDGVVEYTYVSKEEAYREGLALFADDADFLELLDENPQLLPASLRITMETFSHGLYLKMVAERTEGVDRAMPGYPRIASE